MDLDFSITSQSRVFDLKSQLQLLKKDGLSASVYIVCAKTLAYRLASTATMSNQDLLLHNDLGPRYFSFVISMNLNHVKSSIVALHRSLEGYERMLQPNSTVELDKVFHASIANFNGRIYVYSKSK